MLDLNLIHETRLDSITREEKYSREEFKNKYVETLTKSEYIKQDEVELLVKLFAKHPVDVFRVRPTDFKSEHDFASHGDVILYPSCSDKFKNYMKTFKSKESVNSSTVHLQDDITIAKSHMVVTPVKCITGTIDLSTDPLLNTSIRSYEAKLIKAEGTVVITHEEHGNMTLPAGEYLTSIQIDPKEMNRRQD